MYNFTDTKGREWQLSMTVGDLARVKTLTNYKLFGDDQTVVDSLNTLVNDPFTLANILYILCSEQCKERNISDEEFGCSLGGDTIQAAMEALINGVVSFFPPQKQKALNLLREKQTEIDAKTVEKMTAEVNAINLEQVVSNRLSGVKFGDLFTASVEK
jgi:hypothetical protein